MASAAGGAEGESKIIKEARAKLNASLSIDDPTKIKAVLEVFGVEVVLPVLDKDNKISYAVKYKTLQKTSLILF